MINDIKYCDKSFLADIQSKAPVKIYMMSFKIGTTFWEWELSVNHRHQPDGIYTTNQG